MAVVSAGPLLMCDRPTAQNSESLREVFSRLNVESCPLTYNFHMHTNHSDGQLSPHQLVDQVLEIGLKGFAITDHHSVSGFYVAQEYLRDWQVQPENLEKQAPKFWVGTEITAQLLEVEVHILGFAFDPEHAAIADYLQGTAPKDDRAQAHRVIRAIRQSGGIPVLAHPARYRKPYGLLIPAAVVAGIEGVETFYAYGNPKPWKASAEETQSVSELSLQYELLNTCGTDTHGKNLLQRV
jgi:predicted metal-dependent phosphoesterase TrpH